MASSLSYKDMVVYFLNVGQGDSIVIGFPHKKGEKRRYGVVDCFESEKVIGLLDQLMPTTADKERLHFVCATHPHFDHTKGILDLLTHPHYKPHEFWDSGFRHGVKTYRDILEAIVADPAIRMVRVSSGMEWYYGKVRITALSPSVMLRNRYATYGVDVNNASIVLRLEHHTENALVMQSREYGKGVKTSEEAIREAGRSVVILAGDAEFDSWAQITAEYPMIEKTAKHEALVTKMINYLACSVIKVAHHGSMHSSSLDIYEKMVMPTMAVISNKQEEDEVIKGLVKLKRGLYPHRSSIEALHESYTRILTTDGSYEGSTDEDGNIRDDANKHSGSIVIRVPPGSIPNYIKLDDDDPKVAKVAPTGKVFKPLKK
jgi:beta-lactamase superfamily II metal-dependent hydrolase